MAHCINIYLLRHGEVMGGNQYRGSKDDMLTEHGYKQLLQAITELPPKVDSIISSPLRRCSIFAESEFSKSPFFMLDKDIQEINFGDWEGKTYLQIEPEQLKRYYDDPYHATPPNAEKLADFEARVNKSWKRHLQYGAENNINNMLFITHAGVMRFLLKSNLQLTHQSAFNVTINHACLIHLTVTIEGNESYYQLTNLFNLREEE